MPDAALFQTDGPVCTILFNRPERRNAVDGPIAATLPDAFERFEADSALHVAVLGGTGGHFCAGTDLTAVGDPSRRNHLDPDDGMPDPMGPSRMALSKPLVAAVNGHVMAGGPELALLTDLHVTERSAVFGVFCRRWGVLLIDDGTVRLPHIIGMDRVLDTILTDRAVPADEAFAIGLTNRVVGPDEASAAAQKLVRDIATFLQQCVLADRTSACAQWDLPLAVTLQQEGIRGTPIVFTGRVEGTARFVGGAGRLGE